MSSPSEQHATSRFYRTLWIVPFGAVFFWHWSRESSQFAAGWLLGQLLFVLPVAAVIAGVYGYFRKRLTLWVFLNVASLIFSIWTLAQAGIRAVVGQVASQTPNEHAARECAVDARRRYKDPEFSVRKDSCFRTHVYVPQRQQWERIEVGTPAHAVNSIAGCPAHWSAISNQWIGANGCESRWKTGGMAWNELVPTSRGNLQADRESSEMAGCTSQGQACFYYRWTFGTEGYVDTWFSSSGHLAAREFFRP